MADLACTFNPSVNICEAPQVSEPLMMSPETPVSQEGYVPYDQALSYQGAQNLNQSVLTYQREQAIQALDHPFDLDTPYDLNQSFHLLPEPIQLAAGGLKPLNIPISFRVTHMVTPNGQTVPQFYFFRDAGQGSVQAPQSTAQGPKNFSSPQSPNPRGGMMAPISFGVNLAAVIGVDYGLTQIGVPEKLKGPAMLATFYTGSLLLEKAGLSQPTNWKVAGASMPLFFSFQIMSAYGLDAMGIEHNTVANRIGSIGAGMLPFYLARHSKVLDTAIKSSAGGAELVNFGFQGARTLAQLKAATGAWVANPAGGAGAFGGAMQALGAAGAVSLGDYVGGLLTDGGMWLAGYGNDPDYHLFKFVYDQSLAESTGSLTAALFGNIMKGMVAIAGYCSDDIERDVFDGLMFRQNELVDVSKTFGQELEGALVEAFIKSLKPSTPPGEMSIEEEGVSLPKDALQDSQKEEIRWELDQGEFRGKVRALYKESEANIKPQYDLLKLTGHKAEHAALYTRLIRDDGHIRSMPVLIDQIKEAIDSRLKERTQRQYQIARNYKVIDREGFMLTVGSFNGNPQDEEQFRKRLDRYVANPEVRQVYQEIEFLMAVKAQLDD